MEIKKINKKRGRNLIAEKLRVAAYVRVSTRLEKQQTSFDSQKNYYKNKIEQNSNWELVDIYCDNGISGKSFEKRKEFIRMMKDASDGKIDLIVTKSVSRFARNTVDSLQFLRQLKNKGIGVYFEEENINTLSSSGEMLLTVFSAIAQMESEEISSRIKFGYEMITRNKQRKVAAVPYGYKKIKNSTLIKKNVKEAHVIQKIYDLYCEGKSMVEIKRYLNNNKIPSSKNKEWILCMVQKILSNKAYIGILDSKITRDGNIEHFECDNYFPQIISKEQFYKVQEIIKSRAEDLDLIKKNDDSVFYKKVRCYFCGGVMSEVTYYKRWVCIKSRFRECKGKLINYELLHEVTSSIYERIKNDDYKTNLKKINYQIKELYRKKRVIENEILKLSDDLYNNKIYNVNFDKKYKTKNDEIIKINSYIEQYQKEQEKIIPYISIINRIKDFIKNEDNKIDDFLKKYIKFIIVGSYFSNNRADYYHFRFLYKNEFDISEKTSPENIRNINTTTLFDYHINYKLFYRKSDDKKRRYINKVRISFEIEEV